MKTTSLLLGLSSAVLGQVISEFSKRETTAPLAFNFTVEKKFGDLTAKEFWDQNGGRTVKRDGFAETITDISNIYYMMNVYLGSDKQKNYAALDTGSADLWVPSHGYNPNTSTTSKDTGKKFGIKYIDGSISQGEFYLDTIRFESSLPVLPQFQFAKSTAQGPGVLGIGNKGREAAREQYDNLPWALQKAGVTPKASYSLYLGGEGGKGMVIFGGIDTEKYVCCLTKYPMHTPGNDLAINLRRVTVGGKEVMLNSPYTIDSGTSLGFASQELMVQLDKVFNTTIVEDGGVFYREASCTQPSDKYLLFDFGRNTISMSYADFVMENEDDACILGFAYFNGHQILGDVFLRNAFVYFDLTNQTISLAQARHSQASNIITA